MIQNASLDTSFWINAYRASIVRYLLSFFRLYAPPVVKQEILHPVIEFGIESEDAVLFREWVKQRKILIRAPKTSYPIFRAGESQAIALAKERGYLLLIDDSNPYEAAKQAGIKVVGSPDFVVFLVFKHKVTHADGLSMLDHLRGSVKATIIDTAVTLLHHRQPRR